MRRRGTRTRRISIGFWKSDVKTLSLSKAAASGHLHSALLLTRRPRRSQIGGLGRVAGKLGMFCATHNNRLAFTTYFQASRVYPRISFSPYIAVRFLIEEAVLSGLVESTTIELDGWKDKKRYLWLLSPIAPVLALTMLALFFGLYQGRPSLVRELPLWGFGLLVWVIIPSLEVMIGTDSENPPESAMEWLDQDKYYRAILAAYVPTQYIVTIAGAWIATHCRLDLFGYAGLVVTVGGINGIGINTAHELGHKRESVERWLSRITLALTMYGHFYVEHNRGHHVRVSTPEDPASARLGESFWRFLPRTVIGSIVSAWEIEKKRLARLNRSPLSIHNEVLQAWAMTVVVFGAITIAFGWAALPFLILQAIYGFSLLESVNYLEHYGLARRKLPNGRYEPCQPVHSWNSNHLVTNLFLYHLQRHSDHHANPLRRYQTLRHFDDSPQLPSGYASMIVLAYFPPIWYRVMDRRVFAHYKGDLDRANIQPGQRAVVERRLGLVH